MEDYNERYCLCALNRIFGFEPKIALALVSNLGSASEAFRLPQKEIDTLLGPYSKHRGSVNPKAYEEAERELTLLEEQEIRFIGISEDSYPPLLKECEDPPVGIYFRGTGDPGKTLCSKRNIAIIGTRDISPYGREWCRRIVDSLSCTPERPVIISGLALGTDICAHEAALEAGLPTIAVLPTGPDSIYPYRNRNIAEKMVRTPGCALITDYPPGTAPLAIHFLRRNRIIAGMSEATILIESKLKGGGMMTSRLAHSYNREVFALPGRIDDIRSQGCNNLIRSKIAEPIDSVDGLIDSLGMKLSGKTATRYDEEYLWALYSTRADRKTTESILNIFTAIRKERGISLNELTSRTGIPYKEISQVACLLENDGIISIDLMQRCTINTRKSR